MTASGENTDSRMFSATENKGTKKIPDLIEPGE
jgi:hypothetical protein